MDFNDLLILMAKEKASDLFITAERPYAIKVNGLVRTVGTEPLSAPQTRSLIYSVMNDKQQREFDKTRECQFAIDAKGIGRFRASAYVQRTAAALVVRRIETHIPNFEELGLPPVMRELAMTQRGMVILAGATGTGKSTSLAAMIGYRNQHSSGHIITLEDPIEFVHRHAGCIISQREIGIDTESLEVALKNTLRQAPDVILIGEIRTRQAMEYAIVYAETGHLVLATLHANNANQALDRIINFFPEEYHNQLFMELSLNLKGIVAQQLVPRKDGKGRRAAAEVLLNSPLASDLIRKGEIHRLKDLMKRSREQGMVSFDQALYGLYAKGEIGYEDALRFADSANEVRLMIKLGNVGGSRLKDDDDMDRVGLVAREEDAWEPES
ncbi:PilT/PilU family type 4a pilus ATPase [Magnetovirga frankeli]|uniref:PilT/PilU family type 4a pilus ATPase n=1 Tax=Magnetovirga frankeli TaxID=947516 RepID=UPI0012940A92|nr:PilT/PilU family type 4a pilus ATPase [gamma proteobacterium SS-5]